jgi:8-oxo-dGTP diphosphatase
LHHDAAIMTGVMKVGTLCYVRHAGKTLMLHRTRKPNDMHEGKWVALGGKLEPGESPEECAVREVYEESGLRILDPQFRGVLTFPAFDGIDNWYGFVFVATQFTGELSDSTEGVLAWIDDDALLDLPMWEGDRIFLRWLDSDAIFSAKFSYTEGKLTEHQVVFYTPGEAARRQVVHHLPPAELPPDRQDVSVGYTRADDTYCWLCTGPVVKRHCKIVCLRCGFTRDCSDP